MHVYISVHMPQCCFRCVLSSVIMSNSASLNLCVCVCMPVCVWVCLVWMCVSAVCLLYFHVSHWVIGALVIAIVTMQWHMPASWLPDWQDGCCGEMQRMLDQITPRPLPSSKPVAQLLFPCFSLSATRFSKREKRQNFCAEEKARRWCYDVPNRIQTSLECWCILHLSRNLFSTHFHTGSVSSF